MTLELCSGVDSLLYQCSALLCLAQEHKHKPEQLQNQEELKGLSVLRNVLDQVSGSP